MSVGHPLVYSPRAAGAAQAAAFRTPACSIGNGSYSIHPVTGQPGPAAQRPREHGGRPAAPVGPTHLGMVGDCALRYCTLFLYQEAEPSPLFRQSCLVAIGDVVFQLALLAADGFDVLEQKEEQRGGCLHRFAHRAPQHPPERRQRCGRGALLSRQKNLLNKS